MNVCHSVSAVKTVFHCQGVCFRSEAFGAGGPRILHRRWPRLRTGTQGGRAQAGNRAPATKPATPAPDRAQASNAGRSHPSRQLRLRSRPSRQRRLRHRLSRPSRQLRLRLSRQLPQPATPAPAPAVTPAPKVAAPAPATAAPGTGSRLPRQLPRQRRLRPLHPVLPRPPHRQRRRTGRQYRRKRSRQQLRQLQQRLYETAAP